MNIRILFLFLFIFFFRSNLLFCQTQNQFSNYRSNAFIIQELPIKIPFKNIIPNSIHFFIQNESHPVDSLFYIQNDSIYSIVNSHTNQFKSQVFNIKCRVFDLPYLSNYYNLDTSIIQSAFSIDYDRMNAFNLKNNSQNTFQYSNLDYRGAFTRGITLGNNQNLTLNSGFNLQIAGDLGDDIRLNAALTDNTVPIQAEGNTQQIQEFDKVYITISKNTKTLTLGDFESTNPNSFFLNYFKKLQGVQIELNEKISPSTRMESKNSIAINKGKFNRIHLNLIEGNQGPYRLSGIDGDIFIIILAGTEAVYSNGIRLSRGYDRDYIIDYNSGEISFMPRTLITKESRIVIEFEYSNQNYLRSFVSSSNRILHKKIEATFNVYSEQDGKNSTYAKELTPEDRNHLFLAGDSINQIITSTFRVIEPNDNKYPITYNLRDTMVLNRHFSYLTFPWDGKSARYIANFSNVGQGNGNYVRKEGGINGRVYVWVGPNPQTGLLQGDYEPVGKLVAPIQKQMFTGGSKINIDSTFQIDGEVAISRLDLNRFSTSDDEENIGFATFMQIQKSNLIISKKIDWKINLLSRYEYAESEFNPINPYRNLEFYRDWNLPLIQEFNQSNYSVVLKNTIKNKFKFDYTYAGLKQGKQYQGHSNQGQLEFKDKNAQFLMSYRQLNSSSPIENTRFYRPNIHFSYQLQKILNTTIKYQFEAEKNERKLGLNTPLNQISNRYHLSKFGITQDPSTSFHMEMSFIARKDYTPISDHWQALNFIKELSSKVNWQNKQYSNLTFTATIRDLKYADSLKFKQNLRTYLGQTEYNYTFLKNRFNSSTLFEFLSGQERKTEINYVKIQDGTGQFAWIDLSPLDSIQQLNEFFVSPFQDQNSYVKVNILSNSYTPTLNTTFTQSLNWKENPNKKNKNGKIAWYNKLSSSMEYRLERKTKSNSNKGLLNPFDIHIADSNLISYNQLYRHSIYFNRSGTKFETFLSFLHTKSKSFLNTGFEHRNQNELLSSIRYNFSNNTSTNIQNRLKNRKSDSDIFESNKYEIHSFESKCDFTWIFEKKLKISGTYRINLQKNRINFFEKSQTHEFSIQPEFASSSKFSLKSQISFVINQYTGSSNQLLEFVFLEGLKKGKNIIWNITFTHHLKNNIQLSMAYDGRKSETSKTIHTGNMQVKAYF